MLASALHPGPVLTLRLVSNLGVFAIRNHLRNGKQASQDEPSFSVLFKESLLLHPLFNCVLAFMWKLVFQTFIGHITCNDNDISQQSLSYTFIVILF